MTQTQLTELLIHTVKKYPVLYDPGHEDHKRRRSRDEVWASIAEIIGEDREKIKYKWKNLRDSFGKHIRCTRPHHLTGYAAKILERYKNWPWVKQMSFLRPYLEPALNDQFDYEQGTSQEINTSFDEHKPRRRRKRKIDETETLVNEEITNLLNNRENYDNTDLIFLGYSKLIKQMSKRRQATVKFQIAKVIMEAELEQCESPTVNFGSGKDPMITNPLILKCEYAEEVEPEHNSSDSFDA